MMYFKEFHTNLFFFNRLNAKNFHIILDFLAIYKNDKKL